MLDMIKIVLLFPSLPQNRSILWSNKDVILKLWPKVSPLSDSPSEQRDANGDRIRLMDDADIPRGAPSQDNFEFIDDSVDDKDVTFREKTLKVTNRTVYIKEVVPRGFYSTNNLDGGVSRLTVVIFHDRSDHKDNIFMGSCCTDLWTRLGTLNRIAKEGHKVIAIDLPGYGKSASARNVDYVVYQFFTRLEQVLKLDKYAHTCKNFKGMFWPQFKIFSRVFLGGDWPVFYKNCCGLNFGKILR